MGFEIWDLRFEIWDLRFGIWDLRFEISGEAQDLITLGSFCTDPVLVYYGVEML